MGWSLMVFPYGSRYGSPFKSSLEILLSMTLHVDLLHPISDLSSGVDFSLHSIAICPQLALVLVDNGVGVRALCYLPLLDAFNFQYVPFWFLGGKWETIWLSWQSLEIYCVIIWRQIHIFHLTGLEKNRRNLGFVWHLGLWLCTYYLCGFGRVI